MKKLFLISAILLFILHINALFSQPGKKTLLFNGRNLKNWEFYLRDMSADPSSVFTVKDGIIRISGEPFGYMRTKKSFSDYILHVEWRWPVKASNSGIFIHAQLPDTIWPKCIECQLRAGNAGDMVCMNGSDMNERSDKTKRVVNKLASTSEKPEGEWNTAEITCSGSTLNIVINGVLQNKGTGLNINSGQICLQSEGGGIEFRNVWIIPLAGRSGK
ncbi:MAG: 3-keto-disaccharide hydrolase [Bacteroidales bacterium]